jgi:hypothetical protein
MKTLKLFFVMSLLIELAAAQQPLTLEDGTPIRMRLSQTLSSADAHVGDEVSFETLDDVSVGNVIVIPKSSLAIGTVTAAEHKKSMGRAGKLTMNIDYVKLFNGDRAALRGVKDVKGGGHTGAMTGAMVATAIVFFPAAPLFLFVHGKDITIPKGTEVTVFVNGNVLVKPKVLQAAPACPAGYICEPTVVPVAASVQGFTVVQPASKPASSTTCQHSYIDKGGHEVCFDK